MLMLMDYGGFGMNETRIIFDTGSVRCGKTIELYEKRCRFYCTHYDPFIIDCSLGKDMHSECKSYKPKHTGILEDSVEDLE